MILLAGYLDVLFRAIIFIGLACSVGGLVFHYLVLARLPDRGEVPTGSASRNIALIAFGSFTAGVAQLLALIVAPWALADENGVWPLADFLGTGFATTGILTIICSVLLGVTALQLRGRSGSSRIWGVASCCAVAELVSGAWLTHGASRLEHATPLMTLTVLHQFASLVWIGGTIHLVAQWRLFRRTGQGRELWPELPSRFSPLAIGAVALLVSSGLILSRVYIRVPAGLVGSAYGTMLLTKITLMACVLGFGGLNFLAIREWKSTGSSEGLSRRTPAFVEMEAGIGAIILMAAAALVSQPPAIDVRAEWATPQEVFRVFSPKQPQLALAPLREMQAGASSSLDPFGVPTNLVKLQSDFNHNVSGIFVIVIGLAALCDQLFRRKWSRHWPLLFLPFALFLMVFVEPTAWPLGKEGFWETLIAPDVLQHRLAILLVVGLGLFEWSVRTGTLAETRWRYAFPLLCGVGGALLLSHSHSVFAVKWAYLIEVSHNAIGILAVLLGVGRWLELRFEGPAGRISGRLWPVFFTLVGVVLLFYREI
jgi:copper resistance protein D